MAVLVEFGSVMAVLVEFGSKPEDDSFGPSGLL
jgi:hypothetical protein